LKTVVRAVIKDEEGRYLVCLRSKDMGYEGYWEFPGGKVELGQTALQALQEELQEELSYIPSNISEIPFHSSVYNGVDTYFYMLKVNNYSKENLNNIEHDCMIWIRPEQFKSLRWSYHHDLELLYKIELLNS
jgi:8-oxo-dGTP diphosphatase